MCGIVGVVTAFRNGLALKEMDVFRDMLFLDTLRGEDSTGVFGVDKDGNVQIHKDAIPGPEFLRTNEFKAFKAKATSVGQFVVGHNRAATRGKIVAKNAHPFYVNDHIVLVQNGTHYTNHKDLKDTEVDSEAIAHVLAEEPDICKALSKINAAYALVWYNVKTESLHIIRNNARPMYLSYDILDGVLFASEAATIKWAAEREDLRLKSEPVMLEPYTLVTFKYEGGKMTETREVLKCDYVPPPAEVYPFCRSFEDANDGHADWFRAYQEEERARYRRDAYEDVEVRRPPAIQREQTKPETVHVAFPEWAVTKLKEHNCTSQQKDALMEMGRNFIKDKKQLVVSPVDYVPLNNHKECTAYAIYGYLVRPEDYIGPDVVFWWTHFGMTEMEIIDHIASNLFQVSNVSISERTIINAANERKSIVCAFCGSHEVLKMSANAVH
jgi:hypothetical protein